MLNQLPCEIQIADFCRRWKIRELSLFGSALRDDFGPGSNVDLLARFAADADWSLFDHARMERELVEILGRDVDLVNRSEVEQSPNWIRRREILETARTLCSLAATTAWGARAFPATTVGATVAP